MRTCNRLPVDLYDPEVWKRYGWSVIYSSPDFRRHYASSLELTAEWKSEDDLDAYLAATLKRARRFHEALDAIGLETRQLFLLGDWWRL